MCISCRCIDLIGDLLDNIAKILCRYANSCINAETNVARIIRRLKGGIYIYISFASCGVWCLSSRAFGGQVDVPKVSSHRMWDDDCFPQSSVIIHLTNMYHARHLDFRPISGDGHQYLSIFITWTYLDTSCLRPIPPGHPRAPKGTQGATRRHPPRPGLWCRDHAAPFGWSGCLGCGHCHLPGRGPWVPWGSCVSAHVGLAKMGPQFLSHKNHPSNQFFWGLLLNLLK